MWLCEGFYDGWSPRRQRALRQQGYREIDGVRYRGIRFRGKRNEDGLACCNWVQFGFNGRLHDSAGGCLFQNRTPQGLGLVWPGKVRHPHSQTNQKHRDHEGDETDPSTMFYKHAHAGNLSDSRMQYKPVELKAPVSGNQSRPYLSVIIEL